MGPAAWLRWDAVRRIIDEYRLAGRLVEVGCGAGAFSARLAQRFDYVGFEPDEQAAELAKQRVGSKGLVTNSLLPPLSEGELSADVLAAFEVLEHIEDDVAALASWLEQLQPNGHVLISVPAHPERFGPMDDAVGHYRRYSRDSLVALLESVGLNVMVVRSWGFPLGLALESVRHRWAKSAAHPDSTAERTARSGRVLQPAAWAAALIPALVRPFTWVQRVFESTDLGIGWIALARRSVS